MRRRWTDEEVQFLKFAYPNKDFTNEEIYNAFDDRTVNQVRSKAYSLGLKRYKETYPEGFKRCSVCDNILPISSFVNTKRNRDGKTGHCKKCHIKKNKKINSSQINSSQINSSQINSSQIKICTKCKAVKEITNFHKDKLSKDGFKNMCKDCVREYDRKRTILGGYK